jgi:hypothetical protein
MSTSSYNLDDRRERTPAQASISVTTPILFSAFVVLAVATWHWPLRWLITGTPILSLVILAGASNGYRVLPIIPLWSLLAAINLAYAIASTSWLLYGAFAAIVYPAIFLTSLFQFEYVARKVRRSLRKAITQLHFVHDTIALFEIPAMEINVDVEGLMVIRGITISLSTLTIVAHGIEVGIKLADDLEMAICTERVTIKLFRSVIVSDCFANVKGGQAEMTFGETEQLEEDEDGDALMVESTPLLQAASAHGGPARPKIIKMKSQFTRGIEMADSGWQSGWKSIKTLSPEDITARHQYDETLKWIKDTNAIEEARRTVHDLSPADTRASICSKLQPTPSVPHPPKRSIKVTTLQNLSGKRARGILHRMPLLLRLLLNPIAYFHPVSITSIAAAGSGRWISSLLKSKLFLDYAEGSRELRKLEKRITSWLTDANFVFQMADITGLASVPFSPNFDILATLRINDIIAHRAVGDGLEQVVQLGGADASFSIPSFLLPHHEHLLPPIPTPDDMMWLAGEVEAAGGGPQEVLAEKKLKQAEADETNVKISAHVQLPAWLSQELLNFVAALVKATKVVEFEKEPEVIENKLGGIKEFGHAISKGMKDGVKKTVVDGIISDKWIAKMVGKVTKLLEEAQGDVGYSGNIPVKLDVYRLPAGHPELSKILP